MRYLAIGDIHGYADVLARLLDLVQLRPDDRLIFLGDYVDRGPDSRRVLDMLVELNRTREIVALRGNHDFMMLEARRGGAVLSTWKACGGSQALRSYGDSITPGTLEDIPEEHWRFLEDDCVDWYEIDTHFFVHAQVDPDLPLEDQPLYLLHWDPLVEATPHVSGKIMICGHTKQQSGRPRNCGCAVCIDTWVYGDGWLTCLDVKSGKYWQANKHGAVREDWLDDPESQAT